MKTRGDQLLEMTILGQTYQVRVQGSEAWAEKVGGLVDETMKEIQKGTRLSDTTKLAILAALNLADRLLVLEEAQKKVAAELEDLSAGQKMLLRMGPDNEARVKAKLRELKKALSRGA